MKLSLSERPDTATRLAPHKPRAARSVLVAGVLMASVLIPTAAAFAEGSWTSSLGDVGDGFTTRTWADRQIDGAVTQTYVAGCSSPYANNWFLNIELRKSVFGPDKSYGSKPYSSCKSYGVNQSWGNVGSGTFFNQLHMYSYDRASAGTYKVSY